MKDNPSLTNSQQLAVRIDALCKSLDKDRRIQQSYEND